MKSDSPVISELIKGCKALDIFYVGVNRTQIEDWYFGADD
jgi:hypothetical protein